MTPVTRSTSLRILALPLLLAVAAAGLASCGKPPTAPPAEPSAAQTNGTSFTDMLDRSRSKMREKEPGDAVVLAIRRFLRDNRRYPTNLHELVFNRYIDSIPTPKEGYEYVFQADRGSLMIQPKGGVKFMNARQETYEEEEIGAPTLIDGLDVVNP
ncbi:MAG: hypothetical protein U1F77_05710 [Kiritimatiellia bacterium]